MPLANLPKPVVGPVTSGFGPRPIKPSPHNGLDWGWLKADPIGSRRVYAPITGRVLVGENPYVGNFISFPLGGGWSTRLCHFESVAVQTGQIVVEGQYIAFMGDTGSQAAGWHVHCDIFDPYGTRHDPAKWYTDTFVGALAPAGTGSAIVPIDKEKELTMYAMTHPERGGAIVTPTHVTTYRADVFAVLSRGLPLVEMSWPGGGDFDTVVRETWAREAQLRQRQAETTARATVELLKAAGLPVSLGEDDVRRVAEAAAASVEDETAKTIAAAVDVALADDFAAVNANIDDQPTSFEITPKAD